MDSVTVTLNPARYIVHIQCMNSDNTPASGLAEHFKDVASARHVLEYQDGNDTDTHMKITVAPTASVPHGSVAQYSFSSAYDPQWVGRVVHAVLVPKFYECLDTSDIYAPRAKPGYSNRNQRIYFSYVLVRVIAEERVMHIGGA